jgi:hypothetical protein
MESTYPMEVLKPTGFNPLELRGLFRKRAGEIMVQSIEKDA